jgi:ribosomal protein S18 acetylase RimI-like enzyme
MARIRTAGASPGGASEDRMARYLSHQHHPQEALIPRVIYIASEDDTPIGYIAGHLTRRYRCDAELQWIYVVSERRRMGVASELLRALAGWFAAQQASRICVNVEPTNTAARRFYTRHGAEGLNEFWLVWKDIAGVL